MSQDFSTVTVEKGNKSNKNISSSKSLQERNDSVFIGVEDFHVRTHSSHFKREEKKKNLWNLYRRHLNG